MNLALEILIPGETRRLSGLSRVVFQSIEGEIGVMPGHVPMIVLVESGILRAESREGVKRFAAGSGVARVTAEMVSLLVHDLAAEDEIDVDEVRESLEADQRALQAEEAGGMDMRREELLKEIRFAEAKLELLES
jgi:F-type H+-transporting ATPase subunit epsilon